MAENTLLTCDNCKVEISPVEVNCEHCGYPIAGSEKEKAIFIGQQISNKATIAEAGKYRKRSAYVLYIVGALQLLSGALTYMQIGDIFVLLITMAIGVTFIAFGYFSSKRPLLFVALGLGLILSLYALDFVFDPASLTKGILWKIAIVGTLVYSLINSYDEQQIRKKNKSL
ncbi:hypothetical protein GWK08_12570 [Leptobacterium flavescens]|uniref:Zinc ribbon domain-containing protein n=1 Tax=Leptobacterium flavescens TaxID=472055 RepID=A0A6P0UR88_9FLAO|nr:hypothetical protein [Leptobacterium flavescens]NER14279.1 hypothetical protein [Leptobacterium flavescens]